MPGPTGELEPILVSVPGVLQVEVKSLSYFGAKVRVGPRAANVDMVREHMNRGVKLEKN